MKEPLVTHEVHIGPHPHFPATIRFERKVDGIMAAEYTLHFPTYTSGNNRYDVLAGASALRTMNGFEKAHHAAGLYDYILEFFSKLAHQSKATVHLRERTISPIIRTLFRNRDFEYLRYDPHGKRHHYLKRIPAERGEGLFVTPEERVLIERIMEDHHAPPWRGRGEQLTD